MKNIYVVGDSTLAKFNDVSYYYPRYGYGEGLRSFFDDDINIINLALSGRSSKSYLLEKNYQILKYNLKEGDYLIIGFGHNDEKSDDKIRFTNANLDLDDPRSYKYSIYNYYIKLALDRKATPIISTPISRLSKNNKYDGITIHDTNTGNYKNAILELGKEYNILTINLTDITKEYNMNNPDSYLTHAITNGILVNDKLTYDKASVDYTHLNIFGAKLVAYYVVKEISNSNLDLKNHIINLEMPTIEKDLIINPKFKYEKYEAPNLEEFEKINDFYYSYLGNVDNKDSYIYEYKDNKYILGTRKANGKLTSTADNILVLFNRLDKNQNFIFKAHAKILETKSVRQSGFGIQIRDDMYKPYLNKISNSNNISAGLTITEKNTFLITSRELTTEVDRFIVDDLFNVDDEIDLEIIRTGQKIDVLVNYKGKKSNKSFFDFDLIKKDNKYIYVCMFLCNELVVEYSNVVLELTKKSMEA